MRVVVLKGRPAELETLGNARIEHLETQGNTILDVRIGPHPPSSDLIMVILYQPSSVCSNDAAGPGRPR